MKQIKLKLVSTLGLLFLVLTVSSTFSQVKPDKTFDHEKFAKKVYGNFSAGMDQSIFLPDDVALEFIQSKTGKSLEELKKEKERNRTYISTDKVTLQGLNLGGKMVMGVELVKVDHPQLTMGNIIINAQGTKIVLGNCIQTERTWVLGDYMCVEGKVPQRAKEITTEEKIDAILACKDKDYSELSKINWSFYSVIKIDAENPKGTMKSGVQIEKNNFYNCDVRLYENGKCIGNYVKGKDILKEWVSYSVNSEKNQLVFSAADKSTTNFDIYCSNKKQLILFKEEEGAKYYFVGHKVEEKKEEPSETSSNNNIKGKKLYIDPTPRGLVDGANFIDPANFNKPTKGFYIDKDGNKVEAIIKYQEPEILCNNSAPLQLYKTAYNESGFINDEKNNANGTKAKSDILAFAVNGHVYVRVEWDNWGILLKEGAVRECIQLKKATDGTSKTGYHMGSWYKKQSGKSLPSANLVLNFAKSMSEFLSDYPELAEKIKNKEEGYTMLKTNFIIEEYNNWFEEQNPGKTTYVYAN